MGSDGSRPGRRRVPDSGVLIPIAPVLAHYGIDLNEGRWGNELVCCPIHGERRASMSVSIEKGVFHCFACGASGTAVGLVQLMENCDRADAERRAEQILEAAGVEFKRSGARDRYQRPSSGRETVPAGGRRYVPPGRR